MTTQDQTYDTPIRIDDSKTVYVTDETAGAIRDEMNGQADRRLREASALWGDCDVENLDELKSVALKLSQASACVDALVWLAPLADEAIE